MRREDQLFNHNTLPIEPWNKQFGKDYEYLYKAASGRSLKRFFRECLWGLLAVSIFYGLGCLFLW